MSGECLCMSGSLLHTDTCTRDRRGGVDGETTGASGHTVTSPPGPLLSMQGRGSLASHGHPGMGQPRTASLPARAQFCPQGPMRSQGGWSVHPSLRLTESLGPAGHGARTLAPVSRDFHNLPCPCRRSSAHVPIGPRASSVHPRALGTSYILGNKGLQF